MLRKNVKKFLVTQLVGTLIPLRTIARRHGIQFELHLTDDIQLGVFLGYYEKAYVKFLANWIKPGWTCVDVGANIGYLSLIMGKYCGTQGRVISVEADPRVCEKLTRNIELNPIIANIFCIQNVALSDSVGELIFYQTNVEKNSGWGSAVKFDDLTTTELRVPCTTLDELFDSSNLERIDFLKVDVEAHELAVFRGGSRILKKGLVGSILVEWNGPRHAELGISWFDFRKAIEDLGFLLSSKVNNQVIYNLESAKVDSRSICENFLFERT